MFCKHKSQGDLVAAVVELPKHSCQCYADMIRVANDRIIDSLEDGVLVKSVTIYALLVSHYNLDECVPMKYYCNFNECKPNLCSGPFSVILVNTLFFCSGALSVVVLF